MQLVDRLTKWLLTLCVLASTALLAFATWESLQLIGHPFPGFRCEATLTVSANGDPNWNGFKAHLQQFDAVIKVNGQEMRTPDDLNRLVRSLPVGTVLHYDLLRDRKPVKADIATQAFGWGAWGTFVPLIVTALLHLIVGTTAFLMKPKSLTSRVHLLMNLATCLFCASGTDYDSGHLLGRFYIASLSLMASTYLHLGMVFPEPSLWLRKRRWMHGLPYVPTLVLVPWWESFFKPVGALVSPDRFKDHVDLMNLSFLWVLIGMVGLVISIVIRMVRTRSPLTRQQTKVALLGAALGYLPGVLLWIVPFLLNLTNFDSTGIFANLAFICPVFFPLSVAYAIVRHRMFDIDLVIKRTLVYATVVSALTGVYFVTLTLVRAGIERVVGASNTQLGGLVATALVAIAFAPVRHSTKTLIDRLFYRNRYDFRAVVSAYSRFTKETPELDAVVEKFVALADESLHPRHLSIMVRDPKTRSLHVYRASGLSVFPDDFAIAADTPEIGELIQARKTGVRPSRATTRQLVHMDALGIAFCVPLEIRGEVLGMVNVGPKLSDLDYTAEDQALLVNMGQQLASVIRIHEMTKAEVGRARLDAELETARQIQASLLPTSAPAPEGLEVAGSSEAAYEFGGDYYDLVTLEDGRLRVAVGDVAGKGVQAAMVMAMTKSCFYNQVRANADLPTVMAAINSMIIETLADKKHRKTTFVYAAIDPKERRLTYTCAGHQPPHYYNSTKGQVEELPIPGSLPFGSTRLAKYQEHSIPLNPGDVLVFYTDGLPEAENAQHETFYQITAGPDGQDLVADRLKDVIEAHSHASAQDIHQQILKAVNAWIGAAPRADDLTLVVVKVT